jgi:hypothetical protein
MNEEVIKILTEMKKQLEEMQASINKLEQFNLKRSKEIHELPKDTSGLPWGAWCDQEY